MTWFENGRPADDACITSGDAATRALSAAAVEGDFVARVYQKLAGVYDYAFGPALHHGRLEAIEKMRLRPGSSILEVGVGTGISLSLYPPTCAVTGIDVSSKMLEKARKRIRVEGLVHCRVLEMDAAALAFADNTFDVVYAPYVISVVPDPVRVAREMHRVCRRSGRVIFLNHFMSANRVLSKVERAISPMTVHIGFKSDLDLDGFLAQAELTPESMDKVNVPRIWTLVTCTKPTGGGRSEVGGRR
jgi:phosphatidylethanolamine/phosphatidyl-N-methylethanolamine N-methyltransferase